MEYFDLVLKQLRGRYNLKQEDLAKKLHISRVQIANYETGMSIPKATTLIYLRDKLGMDLNKIIFRNNKEIKSEKISRRIESLTKELEKIKDRVDNPKRGENEKA